MLWALVTPLSPGALVICIILLESPGLGGCRAAGITLSSAKDFEGLELWRPWAGTNCSLNKTEQSLLSRWLCSIG